MKRAQRLAYPQGGLKPKRHPPVNPYTSLYKHGWRQTATTFVHQGVE